MLLGALWGAPREAVVVQLPNEEILRERIAVATPKRFLKTINVAEQLANRRMEAVKVGSVVKSAAYYYDTLYAYENVESEWNVPDYVSFLIKSIVKDSPDASEAIEELQDEGLLVPYHAALVRLPVEEVLERRIVELTSKDFLARTSLASILANKLTDAREVVVDIELAIVDFDSDEAYKASPCFMEPKTLRLIKSILADYPVAIEELRREGWLNRKVNFKF